MSASEEDSYSMIFASLKHPIRRKILRILPSEPQAFSDLQKQFNIESSHLTYHIDGLGNLLHKTEDGKYALSSLGEAAVSMMKNVEEPSPISHLPFTRRPRGIEKKIAGRALAIALGIIGIVLAATLVGAFAYYVPLINDKNNKISSLNSQVTNLQNQLTNLRNPVEVVNEQLGLQLTMVLQKTTFKLGESISITLTVRNISNQTINYTYGVPNSYFWVYNDTNNGIYNVLDSQFWPMYVMFIQLDAGESLTDHYVWQQMCNVTPVSDGIPVSEGTYYVVGYGGGLQTTPILIAIT